MPPITGTATSITSNSALIANNIIVSGGAPVAQAGVEYATNPALTTSRAAFGAVAPVFAAQLSGLLPNTAYFYRAFVVAGGSRCVGEIRSFTTAAAGDPLVITGNPFDVLVHTATIRASSYANMPQPPTEVGIEYSLSPTLSGSLSAPAAQPVTPFEVPLSGLLPLTTYYYRAYAVSGGIRYYGEIKTFMTLVVMEVFNGSPADITSTSVLIEGSVFEVYSSGAVLSQIGIEYGTDPSFTGSTRVSAPLPTPKGGLFTLQLTGLTPDTLYYYRTYGIINGRFDAYSGSPSDSFHTLP